PEPPRAPAPGPVVQGMQVTYPVYPVQVLPPVPPRPKRPPRSAALAPPAWPVLAAASGAGLVAAFTLFVQRPGLGWPLTGAAVAATGVAAGWGRRRHWSTYAWSLAAGALMCVGAVRAAGWLYALCVPLALLAGVQAVVGGRTLR